MAMYTYIKNSHCSYCGHPFNPEQPWPRRCTHCGNMSFQNPLPVTIVLIPVDDGVLVIRRNIEPHKGLFALPGGFIELGESWQEAGAREVREEAGVVIDPQTVHEFRVHSAPDGTLIVCGKAPALQRADLPTFAPTDEASERKILTQPEELAFPLHTQIVTEFFHVLEAGQTNGESGAYRD